MDEKNARPAPPVTQETVDALQTANTMEEFLRIARERRVDWNALPDEWLDALAQGDVTTLLMKMKHKPKTGKKKD